MKYCQECGKSLTSKAKFCPECGTQIPTEVKESSTTTSLSAEVKDKPNRFRLEVIGVAVIAIAMLVTLLILTGKPTSPVHTGNEIYLTQDALDGQFKFVITTAPKCGLTSVGDAFPATPSGQFCSIRIWATNKSDKPADFFDQNQKLYDASGNEYAPSTEADSVASGALIYSSVNPGESILGDLYYDIPTIAKPDHMVLHDSAFSGGVTVKLQDDPSVVAAAAAQADAAPSFPAGFQDSGNGIGWEWKTFTGTCSSGHVCASADFVSTKSCSNGYTIQFEQFPDSNSNVKIGAFSEAWATQLIANKITHLEISTPDPKNLMSKYPNLAISLSSFSCKE